jgi:hypothetical protein
MTDPQSYQKFVTDLANRHASERLQMQAFEPLVQKAMELGPLWGIHEELADYDQKYGPDAARLWDINAATGFGTIDAVSLNLRLAPNDRLTDLAPILELIESDKDYKALKTSDCEELKWRAYKYRYLRGAPYPTRWDIGKPKAEWRNRAIFYIRAWFEHSALCRLEGTGEFVEKTRVVCDDTATA